MKLVILIAALAVQSADSLALYVGEHGRPALEALVEAAREHPVLIVGDVHPAAAPKQLLTELLVALHAEGLIDALALEVPMTQQLAIREFLASDPEDTQIITSHPLLLRTHWGASREFLEIYRTVWMLNRRTAAGPRIEILGIDAPRGPPAVSSLREALHRFVNRDAIMETRVRRWREEHPGGRLLVFVGDLHTLKGVEVNVEVETEFARLIPLATRLERLWPDEVVTALSDVALSGRAEGATRLFGTLADVVGEAGGVIAVPPSRFFDRFSRPVILEVEGGAVTLEILPPSYTLAQVTDLYLFFGESPSLTPIEGGPRR